MDNKTELHYRPDVDGLRAVAVLAVIGFHTFPGRVPGGFVGVDIFFVISGFLISSIILKGLESGNFSYLRFYARRVRRIFPALILVLLASLALGWWVLLPDEYEQLGRHVIAGAFFASNFLLLSESGYFEMSGHLKPLLHLWSLGIEEQFYIVWPLCLVLIWRWPRYRIPVVAVIAAASFVLNIALVQLYPTATFYLPFTRCWELLIGALLAAASLRGDVVTAALGRIGRLEPVKTSNEIRSALSFIGAALILASMALLNPASTFPGWSALAPTLGTVLIVAAGPTALLNRRLLSARAVVFVGLISYPLYLWHWPLLSFVNIATFDADIRLQKILAVLLSLGLAIVTYLGVEQWVRRRISVKKLTTLWLAYTVPVGFASLIVLGSGFAIERGPWNINSLPQAYNQENRISRTCVASESGRFSPRINSADFCIATHSARSGTDLLVIGDSHANRLFMGIKASNPELHVLNIGRSTCLPLLDYEVKSNDSRVPLDCSPTMSNLLQRSVELSPDAVILHGFFGQAYDGRLTLLSADSMRNLAEKTFRFLTDASQKVIVVLSAPELPFDPRSCIDRPITRGNAPAECFFPKGDHQRKRSSYEPDLRAAASGFPMVSFVDPADVLCDSKSCFGIRDGVLLYDDSHHLSEQGAALVARFIKVALDKK